MLGCPFKVIKESLLHAPILVLPDPDRPFSVVCDASDFAIGCALLQADTEGRERVIAFASQQLSPAEKNYPVHDQELLAMKYALVKFRVHLLRSKPFVIFTGYASLRTTTQSPHLTHRMARRLLFFIEYNFEVKYKSGRLNVVADALSRRPDYELAHVTTVTSSVPDLIRRAYAQDDACVALLRALVSEEFKNSDKALSKRLRARFTDPGDTPRVVVPHYEDLKYRILYEVHDTLVGGHLGREKIYGSVIQMYWWPKLYKCVSHPVHDTPVGGHLGREKTYGSVIQMYWWPKLYKWASTYVRTCETCQTTKFTPHASAQLASLPVSSGCWKSISMDFVFGLPKDKAGNTGIVVFVDRLSEMTHLSAVPDSVDGEDTAKLLLDRVLGTKLDVSTAGHPQIDGHSERVNRVADDSHRIRNEQRGACLDMLHSVLCERLGRSSRPPDAATVWLLAWWGGLADRLADVSPGAVRKQVDDFGSLRVSVMRQVCDAMAESQDTQKENADAKIRNNMERFDTEIWPRFIGPFKVVAKKGLGYTLKLPKKMCMHIIFYVGLLKPYRDLALVSSEALAPSLMDAAKQQVPAPQGAGAQGAARQQGTETQEAIRMQSHRRLHPNQQIKLTMQMSNLTLKVRDPLLQRLR
ncbi:LOW QUALITY PROTEIN: Retroelement [Phytophthora megakarya]|uniref:Retroelement n=1 Tax=Phytophthora megakarya TaxID=4795 RepID=A0A225W8L4_9STRA|nr:LOW QUALITY PROTEIN: Retroelement [Phytophthora megakarya]